MDTKMRKVVFDVDDTLWPLVDTICSKYNININNIDRFNIGENTRLTEEQKSQLIDAFKNPDIFTNIKWYNGIKRLNHLHEYGVEVWIKSNNFNYEVSQVKMTELQKVLNIPTERIILNIVGDGDKQDNKNIEEDVHVFIDDNPHNLASSKAHINMAIRTPWNTSNKAKEILKGKNVVYCDTLNDIIDYILCIV